MKALRFAVAVFVLASAALATGGLIDRAAAAQQTPEVRNATVRSSKGGAVATTIKGYVIDSACTFTKHLSKPIGTECALACAKAGSPLVIQTAAGAIYWPISADTPAAGQNDKLTPYAGKFLTVTGKVYTKGGSRAIVIDKIDAAS
jgi:hypothetical protein